MRHHLLVGIFSKWPPMRVVLMYYTFAKISKWRKIALIYKLREYKQSLMLNYLKVIDRLQIPYFISFLFVYSILIGYKISPNPRVIFH